jgi:hypothetical protein
MNDTERQVVTELIKKAQAVIDSIASTKLAYAVAKETQYSVNAHTVWDLGTAIETTKHQLKINPEESDRNEP